MVIRKQFTFNGQHIVRNCSSERCKKSIHSHSYLVEIFITSKGLDTGQMVMDFGLMKGTIKDFIGSFGNAYSMWNMEKQEFKDVIYENNLRYIEMPVSPSAESYSLMFFYFIDKIIKATEFNNGEQGVELNAVRVHETKTGYAEASREDLSWWKYSLEDIVFSPGIKTEWTDSKMMSKLIRANKVGNKCFVNEAPERQV